MITIDDQDSFQEAVRYNIQELDSLVMRLCVAQSAEQALEVLNQREQLIQKLSMVEESKNYQDNDLQYDLSKTVSSL